MIRNVKTKSGKWVHRAYVYEVHERAMVTGRQQVRPSINVVCNRVPNWNYSLAVTDEPVTCPECLRRKR